MSSRNPIIIFLDRSGFILYQATLPNALQFIFQEQIVKDLEVLDKEQLVNIIASFIRINRVSSGIIVVLLSDSVVFQKDINSSQENPTQKPENHKESSKLDYEKKENQENEIQNFLENVPFEDVVAKVIGDKRIVAVNKELLETVLDPFKKLGCVVEYVAPSFILDQKVDLSLGLSHETAKGILRQTDLLRFGNILANQQIVLEQHEEEKTVVPEPQSKGGKRQTVLIVVFSFLLVVLAVVYFAVGRSEPSTNSIKNVSEKLQETDVPASTIPSIQPTGEIGQTLNDVPDEIKNTEVTIVAGSEVLVVANALKNILIQTEFTEVNTQSSLDPIPSKSSVLFAKNISTSTRQKALNEIKKLFPDILVLESQKEDQSITITIGKSS